MKKYDRTTKRWVDADTLDKRMNKRDPEACRGKKPHDYVLVLPDHVKYDSTYNFKAEQYYELSDAKHALLEGYREQLGKMGIREAWGWNHKETRMYICTVCKKRKYDFAK